ncbi:MAG: ATP-grasp domain-containing protein [Lachnospiraceae bacterium]|nr:ATP-grasp domain-containing protein [Lachnospiraceae bacterium]
MKSKIQILYPQDDFGEIDDFFKVESIEMSQRGFLVSSNILPTAEIIILRSFIMHKENAYPQDSRMIQGWNEYRITMNMHEYLEFINNWTIPTFISTELDTNIEKKIKEYGWAAAFIKASSKSLWAYGPTKSKWPDTSLVQMKNLFLERGLSTPYIIRKFIDNPDIFYNEQRYWILNGNAYHPSGFIPKFVKEAGHRVYRGSGSKYFTIDVAGDYIVEINPGESSDRGGENPLDFFCDIFAKEFL